MTFKTKTMAYIVVIAVLLVLLAGATIALGSLEEKYEALLEKYTNLREDYEALSKDYAELAKLREDYDVLLENYAKLRENYEILSSSCSSLNKSLVDLKLRHSALLENYAKLKSRCSALEEEYNALLNKYNALEEKYDALLENHTSLKKDYEILRNIGITFDGLRISDVSTRKTLLGYYDVVGNVTNVGDRPMSKVLVILLVYNPDGSLHRYYVEIIENLAVNETNSFEFPLALRERQSFKIFAVGSRGLVGEFEKRGCEVYALEDRDYYYSLIDDLRNARKSISIAMYSMVYDPDDPLDWANDLIEELVYAEERGVNVTVLIEHKTHWGYLDRNLEAYDYLKSRGINAILDEEKDTDHVKLVIIDDEIVYVGSHNWSESALYYNREASVKIVCREIAEAFKRYFEDVLLRSAK